MRVLIVDFDFFTSVGGGQVFYRRVVERHPEIEFHYPSRGPDLAKLHTLPSNARPFALADVHSPMLDEIPQSDHHNVYYFNVLWNVALPLQGMRFDAVDIPSFFPCGRYARQVFTALGITVDRLCLSMLGWLSTSVLEGYAEDRDLTIAHALRQLELSTVLVADVRYTISDMHVDDNAKTTLPIQTIDMDDVLEEFPLPSAGIPGEGPPHIWYVGRLDGAKGADIFLDIVSRVPRHLYSACSFAGPDNDWANSKRWSVHLMQRASELGVKATYAGRPSDEEIRARVYGGRSVVIVPSRTDVFNYVAIEALRSGLPLLLSNKAGAVGFLAKKHPEITPPIIDPDDPAGAADQLLDILENYDERARALRSNLREFPFRPARFGFMESVYRSKPNSDSATTFVTEESRRFVSRMPPMDPTAVRYRPRIAGASYPRISVVIPTFNRAPLLAATLGMLVRQSFAEFEIIVVDDGSADGDLVRSVTESYAPLARYVRQSNAGEAQAVNGESWRREVP